MRDKTETNIKCNFTTREVELIKNFMGSGLADTSFESEICGKCEEQKKSRLWEAVLYDFLKNNGLNIKSPGNEGPDFYFEHEQIKIHIEATTPQIKSQLAEFSEEEDFESGIFDSNIDLERWSGAFINKNRQFIKYLGNSLVKEEEPQIIAISNIKAKDGLNFYCLPEEKKLPRIIEYLYNINTNDIVINKPTGERNYPARISFKKESGSSIPTGAFLNKKFKNISAILIHDYKVSNDWVLIHNDSAINPLPNKFLKKVQYEWAMQKDGSDFTLKLKKQPTPKLNLITP